jgi:hypothetical protein
MNSSGPSFSTPIRVRIGVRCSVSCDSDHDSDSSPCSTAGTVFHMFHLWCWAVSSEPAHGLAAALILILGHLSHRHGCGWGERLRIGLQVLGDGPTVHRGCSDFVFQANPRLPLPVFTEICLVVTALGPTLSSPDVFVRVSPLSTWAGTRETVRTPSVQVFAAATCLSSPSVSGECRPSAVETTQQSPTQSQLVGMS